MQLTNRNTNRNTISTKTHIIKLRKQLNQSYNYLNGKTIHAINK